MELLRNMMVGMIGNFYLCGCIIEKVENIDNGFAIYCIIPEKSHAYKTESAEQYMLRIKTKTKEIFEYMGYGIDVKIRFKIVKGYHVTEDMGLKLQKANVSNIYKFANTILYCI